MSDIRPFSKEKVTDFPQQQELFERLLAVVYEYAGELSTATALGLLDQVKKEIDQD